MNSLNLASTGQRPQVGPDAPKRSYGRVMQRNTFMKNFVRVDSFGRAFKFTLPDQNRDFKTLPGAVCTIFLFLVLLVFAGFKLDVLITRSEYNMLEEVQEMHKDFDPTVF